MPRYEYICTECDAPFEIKATIAEYEDGLDTDCPLCGSRETQRRFSATFVSSPASSNPLPSGPSCGCGTGACGLD